MLPQRGNFADRLRRESEPPPASRALPIGGALERPPMPPAHPALLVGLVGLSIANLLGQNTQPLINGRWQEELALSSTAAGSLFTVQILAGALASIVLSTRLHRICPQRLGLAAGLVLVLANIAQAFIGTYAWLAATCALGGVAAGCLGACAAAAVATSARVDRTAAIVAIASTLLVAGLTLLAVQFIQIGGRQALFLGQAGMFGGACVLAIALPRRRARVSSDRSVALLAAVRSPVILSYIGFNVAATGVWSFAERIGAHLGLSSTLIGNTFAVATVVAMAGALLAATVARPDREKAWALAGIGAFGLTAVLLGVAWSKWVFLFAVVALSFAYVFAMPFITAVAVKQDRSGGLAAAMTGCGTLVGAAAPGLAGILVRHGAYANLGWMAGCASIFAVAALSFVRAPERAAG